MCTFAMTFSKGLDYRNSLHRNGVAVISHIPPQPVSSVEIFSWKLFASAVLYLKTSVTSFLI